MPHDWTDDDCLRFDIERGLAKVTIRGFRRGLTEEDKQKIAQTFADRLKAHWNMSGKSGRELGPSPTSRGESPSEK